MSTHAHPTDLRAWVLGEADGAVSMSVEQHVAQCSHCQGAVADEVANAAAAEAPPSDHTRAPDLALVWDAVRDEVEVPRVSRLERLLTRLGLPPGDAMLVAAAPALRGSWICAVALAVAFAVGGAVSARTGTHAHRSPPPPSRGERRGRALGARGRPTADARARFGRHTDLVAGVGDAAHDR